MSNLKSSKLLEENIWEDLQGLEVGKDFSERTLKAQMKKNKKKSTNDKKTKIGKLGFIKI